MMLALTQAQAWLITGSIGAWMCSLAFTWIFLIDGQETTLGWVRALAERLGKKEG